MTGLNQFANGLDWQPGRVLVGNVLAFAPFGVFLPILWPSRRSPISVVGAGGVYPPVTYSAKSHFGGAQVHARDRREGGRQQRPLERSIPAPATWPNGCG